MSIDLYQDYLLLNGITLNKEKWYCDIRSQLSELIDDYNHFLVDSPNPEYLGIKKEELYLNELLASDLEVLSTGNSHIRQMSNRIVIGEALQPIPNATAILHYNDPSHALILFNSPLLHIINTFFSSALILLSKSRTSNCIEKYLIESQKQVYDDYQVFNKIIISMEEYYENKKLSEIEPVSYYQSPYRLCEMVAAVRRFILSHELSHIELNHQEKATRLLLETSKSEHKVFSQQLEYDADTRAFENILALYLDLSDSQVSINLSDAANGIRMYFSMLNMVECYLGWGDDELPDRAHPFPVSRRVNIEISYLKFIIKNQDINLFNDFVLFSEMLDGLENFFDNQPIFKLIETFPHYGKYLMNRKHFEQKSVCNFDLTRPEEVMQTLSDMGLDDLLKKYKYSLKYLKKTQELDMEYDKYLYLALDTFQDASPFIVMLAAKTGRYE